MGALSEKIINNILKLPVLLISVVIRAYQLLISPWLGPHCRFYPTCSDYAQQAITQHGVLQGGWLTLKRLGRCHPKHEGGLDPVPDPHQLPQSSVKGS